MPETLYLICHPGAPFREIVTPGLPTLQVCAVCDRAPWTRTPPELGLWLDPIPFVLWEQAITALGAGDVTGFLISADNLYGLELVSRNVGALQQRGLYEAALLDAFHMIRTNTRQYRDLVPSLFRIADRARLRAAGDPLPGPGPFTICRGVAGRTLARQIRGLSWTASRARAQWFAERYAPHQADPAVYRVVVSEADVLAYVNTRHEEEFIVQLPASAKPERVGGLHGAGRSTRCAVPSAAPTRRER